MSGEHCWLFVGSWHFSSSRSIEKFVEVWTSEFLSWCVFSFLFLDTASFLSWSSTSIFILLALVAGTGSGCWPVETLDLSFAFLLNGWFDTEISIQEMKSSDCSFIQRSLFLVKYFVVGRKWPLYLLWPNGCWWVLVLAFASTASSQC